MKNMKKLLTLFLALAMVLSVFASCEVTPSEESATDTESSSESVSNRPQGKQQYTIEIKTLGGMKMEDVMCYIHVGDDSSMVARAQTDENGIVAFELSADADYTVELEGVPEGYLVQDRYELYKSTTITLVSQVIQEGIPASHIYKLGDVMHDFTVTTTKGETLKLSELLEEKKMVMLNFWFSTCGPCMNEFPYMNADYNRYREDIEIIAINDYVSDTAQTVANFVFYDESGNARVPDFPLVKDDNGLHPSNFEGTGYPTNVIIDRYGVICAIESGAIVQENVFANAFSYFAARDYQQKLATHIGEFTPIDKVDIEMPSPEEISAAFDGNTLDVRYYAAEGSDAEYSWPFLISQKDGAPCIHPSNIKKNSSYSILNMDLELKEGEALLFDYFSSTQSGSDIFYVLVNGKDIYSISGVSDQWDTCCAYVAQETAIYQITFCYMKDGGSFAGDDTVYLRNLRIANQSEVPVQAYIFRFAATQPTADGTGYTNYSNVVYNEVDGYYHVESKDGPILLANLLGYTNFDSEKSVFQRFYEIVDKVFEVNGKNCFDFFEDYGNFAANSVLYGYCSVTKDLKEYLETYVSKYRRDAGKTEDENLWLQLCSYYDSYGPDAEQLEDPIRGLARFSAYKAILGENTVTYTRALMPRGFYYEFIPEESGVYRVTSHADAEVDGWIAVFDREDAISFKDENMFTSNAEFERYCPALTYQNEDGTFFRDMNNCSMLAYMEAGKAYYIDICYYDLYLYDTFTFDIEYVGEYFDAFFAASPGPFTYIEDANGQMGDTIAGGIQVKLCDNTEDERFGYYCELRKDGSLGKIIYADFLMTTDVFASQTLFEMIDIVETVKMKDGTEEKVAVFDFGDKGNYTERMREYAQLILNEEDYPERSGCVPVDEELAGILQKLMDKYTFENVENSWVKLCYYYKVMGPVAE